MWAPSGRVVRRIRVVDGDFVHFVGLWELDMCGCTAVTDAAFARLRDAIRTLCMRRCSQATITDAAFEHLRGIRSLDMSCCNQATITDAAFAPLAGIRALT